MTASSFRFVLGALAAAAAVSAPAQSNFPSFRMDIVGVADGPFKETRVFKLRDRENATTCYFYVPQNINVSQFVCPGGNCVPVINSQMGSISCVRDAPPPAQPASERKP